MRTPPPPFLFPESVRMNSVGIDISDQSIKYVKLGRGFSVEKYGEIKLPQGVITGGTVVDSKRLVEILRDISKREKIHFVRASLPEEHVYLYRSVLSADPAHAREAIEISLEEHIPLPATEIVFDFEIVEVTEKNTTVQVSAVSSNIAENYSKIFIDAGMVPVALELEAEAVARAVSDQNKNEVSMVIDFGGTRTGISVVCGTSVLFTSTIPLGGSTLTDLIAKDFKVSIEEAENLKRAYGLVRNSEKDVFSTLLSGVSVLRDEINKNFIYWHTHPDETGKERPKISSIYLSGGDSNLKGLPEYLSASLKVEVKCANVWVNMFDINKNVPVISFADSLGYATAIGLALGESYYE